MLAAQKADADAETAHNQQIEQAKLGVEQQRTQLDAASLALQGKKQETDARQNETAQFLDLAKHVSGHEHDAEMQKNAPKPTKKK